jgi:DNA-binding GntR family transcriptional regulator
VARARLLAPADGDSSSLADRAYYAIREMIVSLQLRPGAVINERELVDRMRIGRTPTREALRRLSQEGLVEVYPRRGMFVTTVDVRDLSRLSEVRVVLEPEAALLAAQRATDAETEAMNGLLHEIRVLRAGNRDERRLIDLDERIHHSIYRATHNRFLEATLEQYYALALRIWMIALGAQGPELADAVSEHTELLQLIVGGDGKRAARLMREHVRHFEETMREALLAQHM